MDTVKNSFVKMPEQERQVDLSEVRARLRTNLTLIAVTEAKEGKSKKE